MVQVLFRGCAKLLNSTVYSLIIFSCLQLSLIFFLLYKKTFDFFKSLSMLLYNNYGLSESTGPAYSNFNSDVNTVGIPLPGTQGKIMNKDSKKECSFGTGTKALKSKSF